MVNMFSKQIKEDLANLVKGIVLFDEPMKRHTSFRIGGPAEIFIEPKDENDLRNILIFVRENDIPINIIGNGTNLLISDNGVKGVVIKMSGCFNDVTINGETVAVGAGFPLPKLSRLVADRGLSGLEFAVGIPGTVGGAVMMNAGAHGSAMSDVVTKVRVMNFEEEISELSKKDLKFGQRKSELQKHDVIVINAEIELKKGDPEEIKKKMAKYLQWRKDNQPLDMPNAGSIFKNPPDDYAGRLIDLSGCKGLRIGGAQVSKKHANFIVNLGNAKADDIMALINIVHQRVKETFDIDLELEIKIIGEIK